MKIYLLIIASAFCTTVFAQKPITTTFKVSGNCNMCKKHIEKAAMTMGVAGATWNKDTKKLLLTYDPAKISADKVQQNIAAAGYDTEKFAADEKAYKALDECCQYERVKPVSKP